MENQIMTLAHNPDIENAILGAIIVEDEAWDRVNTILKPEMFGEEINRQIYNTILGLKSKNKKVDSAVLYTVLKENPLLKQSGGITYLLKLQQNIASAGHLETHAMMLAEQYAKQLILSTTFRIQQYCYSGETLDDIFQLWDKLDSEMGEIAAGGQQVIGMEMAIRETLEQLNQEASLRQQGILSGITTGFTTLDNAIGGFRQGTMNVIGARPGVGKTSIALWMGVRAAREGKKVLFISYEMLIRDLISIIIAAETNIDRVKIRDAKLDESSWYQINESVKFLNHLPLRWIENPALTGQQIAANIKREKRKRGLDLVIVDYLQLIRPSKQSYNREQEISSISRELKKSALSEQVAIIALSQLNREADGKEPELSHLRESGALEQDSDVVLLPYKPYDCGRADANMNQINLKLAKNRRGLLTEIPIYHNYQMVDFSESGEFNRSDKPSIPLTKKKEETLPF